MKKFLAISFAMMCMTLTSFAGDLLTAAMFHSWSSSGAGAVDNGATGCNYKINDQSASDGLPYGDGNVYYLNYADLTAYSTMEIEFTEGTPRLLFNRDGDNGPLNPEINGSAGMDYVTVGEGIWTIDLAAITKAFGYAHLNCIKGANWANATITRVELFKAAAPVNPNNMLTGDAFNFEGGTTGGWGAWGELAGDNGVVSPGFESDYCFKAVTKGTGDNWKAQAGFTFPAALDPSVEYTLKFMAKGSGTVQMFYQSSDYANQDYKSMFTLTDEWQEFTEKYTPGYDNIVRILFSFGQCTELYVDNIEFAPASAPAPVVDPVKVESYVGDSYEGIGAGIEGDLAKAVADYLGVTAAEEVAMATYDEAGNLVEANNGRGETDGWRNAEGAFVNWGAEGFTYYVQPYAELDEEGNWYIGAYVGSAPGAVTAPIDFTQKVKFYANGKSVEFPITLSYVNRPELKIEVQEEVDVPAFTYDFTLGYAGAEGTFDISMVEDAIGCTAAEAEVFGFNPSTEEAVRGAMATFDGWHAANGDLQGWGEAPFCIKFYNNGTFWYCAMPDVAELGATYKTAWLLVNPETGDAVQYNFTMNDIERAAYVLEDGEYYFYNAEAGAWLGGGNSWGTQASLLKHGYPFHVTKVADNVYTIDSYTYNKEAQHFLGANLYIDADATNWTAEKVGKGASDWAFSVDGNYMGYDGSSNILVNLTDKDAAGACWTLVTRAELEALLLDAAPDSPVDATFLIQVPNFSRNQAYTAMGQSPWTAEAANKNLSGGNDTNRCAESWNSSNGFNVYQTLTNLPNGNYRLDVQGSVCDYAGTFEDLACAYANEQTSTFISSSKWADGTMEDGEKSMAAMSDSFTAGKYQLEPIFVTVTDGTLTIGVKTPRTDTWAVWDNFELTYLGVNVSVKKAVEVPAFEYDYALGYDGGEGTYDIATVEETIGCAAADAAVYGYNPSTGEYVKNGMDVSDGWHAANGDFAGWGEAPFCLKFYNDGTFWYCAMPDVAELGATYKASWLLVNPRTGDAVQYNFTMNDVTRGPIFAEGEYYLYNEEADAWLGGGNSWGTHATLIKHGMPVYIGECQNGNVYTINTYTYNNANDHYLGWDAGGSGFFVDAYSQGLTFTKVSGAENKYFISANGSYIGTAADAAAFAGSPVDLLPTTDVAQAAQWTLVTRAEREAILAAATPDSPADATFLIQVPNFSRNQAYTAQGQSPWTKEAANCNISGGDNTNNNAESWRSSNGFNVYQTLTNLPTGVYRIDVQGAVCEYANPKNGKDLAVAYANDATTPFVVSELADRQAGNENSMSEMSASFTAGKYQLEPMYVTVTDGTLTVGVKSPRTDTWAVWDNFELTYYGEDYIPAGEYYLYNAEAGAWLAGGNSWGTQASLNKHGMPVYISYEGNNAYSIDTYTYNSDVQHFLGSNLYVDADKTNWTVERVGEGVNNWAFSVAGNYVGYDGSSDILVNLTDKNAAGACWTLVTRAERQATLAEATIDNPVDATFYIEVPNFSRNQAFTARNQSPWTAVGANVEDAAGNKNLSGGNNINNNAESWRSSNGFNVYQTLTNLPSGVYELRAQAAVCDYAGTFVDLAYVYANDKKSAFNSSSRWAEGVQENGENSMSAMSESFTAGKYAVKPIHILVTDGQIELGVYSPRTDTWAVWDNFELYYLGQDAEVNHEDPKYTMVATDNVVIEYHATAPQASQAIDATNYLATLGAASAEETQLYAVDTNAGLTLDPLSWVNFTGYFNAEGCVSGLVDAAVKANVDLAGKQVTVEALAETVEPRYHAYAVLACEKTAKAILIAIEVNFVDRPDYAEFTAINNVKADGADAKIFDLSGREVKKATKGVYIINGVKTFVK